jgi:23S rRNA pseudouridine2604 synthase
MTKSKLLSEPSQLLVRVSKLLANRGLCSRREADRYIEEGRVLVDGKPIFELGAKAHPEAKVELTESAMREKKNARTILLHKPLGVVSNMPEKGYKEAKDLITYKGSKKGLHVTGRLDIDSTGLLVLTEDGTLAKKLIGENSEIEKEYHVRIKGSLTEEVLKKLSFGLSLDGKQLKKAQVLKRGEDALSMTLTEGKKRQVRRMCELVGLKVVALKRVRIGKIKLGNLSYGKWRFLKEDEVF